jgi:hypothetical protein
MSSDESDRSCSEENIAAFGAGSDLDSFPGDNECGSCRVPRRIRNAIDLEHMSRVKQLERQMVPLMSKGPRCERDVAKAAFDARLDDLKLEHARSLQKAAEAAASLSPNVENSVCLSEKTGFSASRSVRVASEKRHKLLKKIANYNCRRIYKEMRLLQSANSIDFSDVNRMIQNSSANLEYRVEGQTLLLAAADMGMHEVISALLLAGARVDAQDEHGRCAAAVAASRNYSTSVGILLDHMNRAIIVCSEVWTCMEHAIRFCNPAIARTILHHVQVTNSLGFKSILDQALIAAATAGDAIMLQLFLEQGACANAVDSLRRSALMHAVASKVWHLLFLCDSTTQLNTLFPGARR